MKGPYHEVLTDPVSRLGAFLAMLHSQDAAARRKSNREGGWDRSAPTLERRFEPGGVSVTPLFMSTVAALCAVLAGVIPASAQYPTRPVTLIVPFAAGGPTDTVARIIAEHMAKTLGQSIVVENDAGAGGTTATARGSSAG
jgi:hypothetical protein